MKVQITMADELMGKVDEYADANYTTRSGFITQAVSAYISSLEIQSLVKGMALAMNKIADKGEIDKVTMHELEDFQRVCELLVRK